MIRLVPEDGEVHLEDGRMVIVSPAEMGFLVRLERGKGHFVKPANREVDKTFACRLRRKGIALEARRGYGYRMRQ